MVPNMLEPVVTTPEEFAEFIKRDGVNGRRC
jgi:hypothetical protein